jgi:hypothetical protein
VIAVRRCRVDIQSALVSPCPAGASAQVAILTVPAPVYGIDGARTQALERVGFQELPKPSLKDIADVGMFATPGIAGVTRSIRPYKEVLPDSTACEWTDVLFEHVAGSEVGPETLTYDRLIKLGGTTQWQERLKAHTPDIQTVSQRAYAVPRLPIDGLGIHHTGK